MTRVTNFGRKRTYVEAGFAERDDHSPINPPASTSQDPPPTQETPSTAEPTASGSSSAAEHKPKKVKGQPDAPVPRKHPKRHRSKKGKGPGAGQNIPRAVREAAAAAEEANKKENRWAYAKDHGAPSTADPHFLTGANGATSGSGEVPREKKSRTREPKDSSEGGSKPSRAALREQRRVGRINEKLQATTCFACREKGHAAKDCPKAEPQTTQKAVTGICYRCGSTNHNLSKCKKTADPENPLPFAACFVCSGTGHLAGGCPQNQNKGVYPNGGCCKICGDTTHLAKECGIRRNETLEVKGAVGTGFGAGADEDDFMVIKRREKEVEKEEHMEERFNNLLAASEKAPGALTRKSNLGASAATAKRKVVVF